MGIEMGYEMKCDCDPTEQRYARNIDCLIHVSCDEDCKALENPITLDDYKLTLEHYREHGFLSGCSHGN